MPSSSRVKKRSLISDFKYLLSGRSNLSIFIKCGLCIIILYFINFLIGFKSYLWSQKSFEDEYYLTMTHIDPIKIEKNIEELLGSPINILSNRFLIDNEYFCGRSLDPQTLIHPHLLILVKSFSENYKQRQAIRLTWANKSQLNKKNARLAFVLGTNPHNISVNEESRRYGDIIQIDKMDYYYYSSYKMIMMLRWITDYCTSKVRSSSHADLRNYVLFVDDDYYIDVDSLLLYIRGIDENPEMTTYERRIFITGEVIQRSKPRRFVNDRWYVSLIDYPYDIYPDYISSQCFLMTRYNARLFYLASKYIRLFYFDHVYMGLLAHSMSISFIKNNELFSTSLSSKTIFDNQNQIKPRWKEFFNQEINLNSIQKSICIRGHDPDTLIEIWNQIHQTNITFSLD